jgi:hypothetical protein
MKRWVMWRQHSGLGCIATMRYSPWQLWGLRCSSVVVVRTIRGFRSSGMWNCHQVSDSWCFEEHGAIIFKGQEILENVRSHSPSDRASSQMTYMLRNSAVRTSNLTKWESGKDRTWTFAPVRTVSYIAIWRGLLHSPREWITGFYDLLKIRPTCQLTWCHIPQDSNLQHLRCGNLQSSGLLSLLCEADHIVLRLKMQVIIQFLRTFLWHGT